MQKTCVAFFVPCSSYSMFGYVSFTIDRTYISTESTLLADENV